MKTMWINLRQSSSVMSNTSFKPARKYPAFNEASPGLSPYISAQDFIKAMSDKEYAKEILKTISEASR